MGIGKDTVMSGIPVVSATYRSEPVAGHRPETDTRQYGNASLTGLLMSRQRGDGDGNLVGDVEVLHSRVQACPQHCRRGAEARGYWSRLEPLFNRSAMDSYPNRCVALSTVD